MDKVCSKCKNLLHFSAFNKDAKRLDGHYPYCRSCVKERRKKVGYDTYAYNPESHKRRQRKARAADNNKAYEKSFRKGYLLTFEGKASKLLASAKHRAQAKGREFDLDLDWVKDNLSEEKCQATGVSFVYEVPNEQRHGDFSPSVDRVDNTRGYTKDNCQIVCLMYNRAKSEGTLDNVLMMAKEMVKLHDTKI